MATRGKLGTCELCGWHRLDGPTAFTLRDIRLKRRGVLMFAMYDDGNDSAVSSHCASCKVDKLYYNIYKSILAKYDYSSSSSDRGGIDYRTAVFAGIQLY